MKYAALLRGINVGGRNIVYMDQLQSVFKNAGFSNIQTYIQSGNVVFEYAKADTLKITQRIEAALVQKFPFAIKVMVRSHDQLKKIIESVPEDWNTDADMRRYIAFLSPEIDPTEAVQIIDVTKNVDVVTAGPTVLYLSTTTEGFTKSKLNKLVGKTIYKEMTMRNFVTSKKLLELLESPDAFTRSDS